MEKSFFELYSRHPKLALEVKHNPDCGWWDIKVYDLRPDEEFNNNVLIIHTQDKHREIAFAEAYITLTEYFKSWGVVF